MVWFILLLSVKLIPHGLTPGKQVPAFGVWLGLEAFWGPLPIQCSTSGTLLPEAVPKNISGSASYPQI